MFAWRITPRWPLSWLALACLIGGGCAESTPPKSTGALRVAMREKELPAPLPRIAAPPAEESLVAGKILLGSPRLTAGIPGSGPLTLAEIDRWLADPANFEPLDFELPLGLREAAGKVSIPPDNPLTRAKIELGRQLFCDRRLSHPLHQFSCLDCHHPRDHFAFPGHNLDLSVKGMRGVPTVLNRIVSQQQFYDGRAASLEEQALMPLETKNEMATDIETCLARLRGIEGYRRQFEAICGGVTATALAQALASFERVLVTGPAPIDYFRICQRLEGRDPATLSPDERELLAEAQRGRAAKPLSSAAQRGWTLFNSEKAQCSRCHPAPTFSDEQYHNIGIEPAGPDADLGRYLVSCDPRDRRAFKTPSLRGTSHTGPFMHRGQLRDLRAVLDWYDNPPQDASRAGQELQPLGLTEQEKSDLIELLQSCDGEIPVLETERLPP